MMWINLFMWVTAIIAILLVAAVTPTPQGDKWLAKLYSYRFPSFKYWQGQG